MTEDRRHRILVVEDNEVNQALSLAILAKLGYRAEVVGDGRQAVELVPRGPPSPKRPCTSPGSGPRPPSGQARVFASW